MSIKFGLFPTIRDFLFGPPGFPLMPIYLLRHGQTEANAGVVDHREVGDWKVSLTDIGRIQMFEKGKQLGPDFIRRSLIFCGPYSRHHQSLECLLDGARLKKSKLLLCREDSLVRERDIGYDDYDEQDKLRKRHGVFFYRHSSGGEAPTDSCDRVTLFLSSLIREIRRHPKCRSVFILSSSMFIQCFVKRFFHLTVAQFHQLGHSHNADLISIAPKHTLQDPQFTSRRWGVTGLRSADEGAHR